METRTVENKNQDQYTSVVLTLVRKDFLCKVSKQPESSVFRIEYVANTVFLEMRQLDILINSVLDKPMDLETLIQYIAEKLCVILSTNVCVKGYFKLSGGVSLNVISKANIL